MPTVRVSEIYDLNTVQNKVGVIGIHTPSIASLSAKWQGFFLNHRYFRILNCDVQISCASMLPVDPLGIGTAPGKVAPQDMMNPILYRAVSNDSWNLMVGRLYGTETGSTIGTNNAGSIRAETDAFAGATDDQERLYYSLLASDEWRKAMPQQGLNMVNLKPFCFPIVSNFGQGIGGGGYGTTQPDSTTVATASTGLPSSVQANINNPNSARLFRGPAVPLPRFACTPRGVNIITSDDTTVQDRYHNVQEPYIPRIYCGCIVMPPARLQAMYYRMKVSWLVSFEEPVSILEKRNLQDAVAESYVYYKRSYDFDNASKLADANADAVDTNTIDTLGFEPTLVMDM